MQTSFSQELLATRDGQEAERILRSCVHCGFCMATCPTYLQTGNELDSPRGRIYLIKTMLEDGEASSITRTHLDRCLTCQSCESTCPSSVDYHSLLNIGRKVLETQVRRPVGQRAKSWAIRKVLHNPLLFNFLLSSGRTIRALLPSSFSHLLQKNNLQIWAGEERDRKMIILNGCVQNSLSPETNAAASRVFSRLGIKLEFKQEEGCCGALAFHLDAQEEGLAKARQKIDLLCAELDSGVEAIISTASGCGNFIDQYDAMFADDPVYAEKATRIKCSTRDISQVLMAENISELKVKAGKQVAFHCPCTLQHGLNAKDVTEELLEQFGINLTSVKDSHLCCGSAGAYSLMQAEMSIALREEKLENLMDGEPEAIVTSNIGCQLHLRAKATVPVMHWINLLDDLLV